MRVRSWSWVIALGVAGFGAACSEEMLSVGEDRCYGEETICERPCTAVYDARRRAVDETMIEAATVVPLSGELCEEAGLFCERRDRWGTMEEQDTSKLIPHPNGELSIVIETFRSEVEQEGSSTSGNTNDLHVLRLAKNGELLWSRKLHSVFEKIGKPEPSVLSLTAVADDGDNGLLVATHEETKPASLKVARIDSSGEIDTLFSEPSADAPRGVAGWQSKILVLTHFEATLYEPDGSLVWRQTNLENAPSTREPSPYALAETMAVDLAPDADGNMIVLRKESNYQIALLKLSPKGNVLTHAYLPTQDDLPAHCTSGETIQPLHPGDPGALPDVPPNGRVPRPTGNTRYEPDITASTPDAEKLFSVATLDVDGAGHPVTLQGNVVGRFPSWAEYDATDPDDYFRVEAIARTQEFASPPVARLDLAVGPDRNMYVLTDPGDTEVLIDLGLEEVHYNRVLDRITWDAGDDDPPQREVIPLPVPQDGTGLVYDSIRFGADGELYAYARSDSYDSMHLVRIELPD